VLEKDVVVVKDEVPEQLRMLYNK